MTWRTTERDWTPAPPVRSVSAARSPASVLAAVSVLAVVSILAAACGSADQADLDTGRADEQQPMASASATVPPACTPPTDDGPATPVPATDPPTTGDPPTTEPAATDPPTTEPAATDPPTTGADEVVQSRQAALSALGYWLGPADGVIGPNTAHAVTAFQKAEQLERTGSFDAATVDRLATASRPQARDSAGDVMEVDLARQILMVVSGGQVAWTFDIATGASDTPTPTGEFSIYREIDGIRHAPLGTLYRPKYFNGGVALHGYTSVPAQPASHGCVRLTYAAMDFVWESDLAPLGTVVAVY
ncbi:MAG: L,D-transpeptidase family protein [Acidimicrobiales bacterium]